jgi:hypothetical protein
VIRRLAAAFAAIVLACELTACSHGSAIACEPTTRYAAAATAGPVRIPDDLNPPDETDSLRLPPENVSVAQASKPCLESPPGFYADGAPNAPRGGAAQRRPGSGSTTPAPRQAAPPPQPPAATPAAESALPPVAAPAPTAESALPPVAAPAPAAESAAPPAAAPAPPAAETPPGGSDREITN